EVGGFDLVHLHSVFLWPTWAAARFSRKAHTPYVVSPRGMLVKELIGRRQRLVKSAWIRLIEQSNLERASAIHVTSELEAAELARFKWRLPQVARIPYRLDGPEIGDRAVSTDVESLTDHQPLVLFLGRLSWKKGLDRLLWAFARTDRGHLAVVGPDDENLLPRLRELALNLGIGDRVKFLPRT